ncbi:sigma-54-dependent Fis family transcriptional regulator [Cryobacterium psychrophilum]|uniref:GAF domain-containing protein n=1 Tax=Cryobacterium psychrophilum TaxID=41988 RepID=A0A4Y8KJU9_9MICO|nr:helix-turn-helix domain-containing protein [Cryobacterium psychrophilum]TDW30861.1 GAF domain-containing protein [Cryobacterium psychrophilum]TFD75749.1 GAF domain-containing protein [Cryobacterium psychrophilum]
MPETAARRRRIAAARADFLRFDGTGAHARTAPVPDVVAGIVAASWQRSFSAGVNAATAQAVFHDDLDLTSRLMRCSKPVIARLSDDMAQMPLSIVLTDARARILSRSETNRTIGTLLDQVSLAPGFNYAEGVVGTNGIGTVLESGQSLYIVGPEHFNENLQSFACAGSPIRDPLTGRVEGVLDISCLSEDSSPLMRSVVQSAAHEIERNLLVDRSQRQQALFEAYVRADARTRGAVMAVGGTMVMGNAIAQSLFEPAEQWAIHEHARYLLTRRGQPIDQIELTSGKVVNLRGTRVGTGDNLAGIVLLVDIESEAARVPFVLPAAATGAITPVAGPIAPADDVDRSLLAKRTYTGIVDALQQRRSLIVGGEAGSGKLSVLVDLFHRVVPTGRTRVYASTGLSVPAPSEDLPSGTEPMLFVFTNIDQLTEPAVDDLDRFLVLLAASERPLSIAATMSGTDLDPALPFTRLLARFEASVTVAPLRHRLDDLPVIATRVLANLAGPRHVSLSPGAMRVLSRYTWPRNIRQLEEALEAALLKRPVGEIQPEDLPGYCHTGARRLLSPMEAGERDLIIRALRDADGNRVRTAEALGIARSSLYRKLKTFGIDAA